MVGRMSLTYAHVHINNRRTVNRLEKSKMALISFFPPSLSLSLFCLTCFLKPRREQTPIGKLNDAHTRFIYILKQQESVRCS
mmetsp:Transcript_16240/g.24069  ORF Transcript_16240/g.24069 Transcript_16240/m.24069 type:complete len:82 (-) Transcript_16240:56-301(-)